MYGSISRLLSMRCALREPQSMSLLANLHSASCNWLVQVAIHKALLDPATKSYAPLTKLELKFPIDDEEPDTLRLLNLNMILNLNILTNAKY